MDTPSRSTETLDQVRPREVVALRPGRVALRIVSRGQERLETVERRRVTIGAHESCAIVIADPAVSAAHCELQLGEYGSMLRDCNSKNGTWHNGASIRETWLGVGQSFRLGNCTVTLEEISNVEVPVSTLDHFGGMHGVGPIMGELFAKLERIAASDLNVLCKGEPGTGKELLAQSIHRESNRSSGPFVAVDCKSFNREDIDGALFGRGDRAGALENAHRGTLFLSEVMTLPLEAQAKLSRCLENHAVRRMGTSTEQEIDLRVISATSQDPIPALDTGLFIAELLYRLASSQVEIPALRDRDDGNIIMLANVFLQEISKKAGRTLTLDRSACLLLDLHTWPGNVLELLEVVTAAAATSSTDTIRDRDITIITKGRPRIEEYAEAIESTRRIPELFGQPWDDAKKEFGRLYATHLMTASQGSVLRAAFQAGVHRNTIARLLREDDDSE